MTVCMYRDINTLQPYIIDFTQRGCHTLRLPAFYRARKFISPCHLSLSWARSIQSLPLLHSPIPLTEDNTSFTEFLVSLPLLRSYQRISPGPRICINFRNNASLYGEELLATLPTPKWRTTPSRLSATAYSIYSQLPSILEAVPPTETWGGAMPWWQGPTYRGRLFYPNEIILDSRVRKVPSRQRQ